MAGLNERVLKSDKSGDEEECDKDELGEMSGICESEPKVSPDEEEKSNQSELPSVSRPIPMKTSRVGEKKTKLRTSKDIYDRLRWDTVTVNNFNGKSSEHEGEETVSIDVEEVYIGYEDRFLGMCEIPYLEFHPGQEGDIPFHRVYYFRTGGPPVDPFVGKNGEVKVRDHNLPPQSVFLWDRESRTDLIFHSGDSHPSLRRKIKKKKEKQVLQNEEHGSQPSEQTSPIISVS